MEERDADDSATALREAMEEIGLDPQLVRVVANLEPFNSLVYMYFHFLLLLFFSIYESEIIINPVGRLI